MHLFANPITLLDSSAQLLRLLLHEKRADVIAGGFVVLDVASVAERELARSPAPDDRSQ